MILNALKRKYEKKYEVSYDGKCETKNDEKLNRNSEL